MCPVSTGQEADGQERVHAVREKYLIANGIFAYRPLFHAQDD